MNGGSRLGLGIVALVALCCAGPLVLSLLASGALLGVLSMVLAEGRPLLVVISAVFVVLWGASVLVDIAALIATVAS